MTLGELKLETLKQMDEAENLTSSTVSESDYDSKMLGALNRTLRRIYDLNKLPLTTGILTTDAIVVNDSEIGYIFNGYAYGTLDSATLNIPQYILDLLPLGMKADLLFSEDQRAEATNALNLFESYVSELPTPSINATVLNRTSKVVSTYNVNNL